MKLAFIFGLPAVGKLTIARELAERTGWRLFHNHEAVDAALARHEFGTPGFVALREEIWTYLRAPDPPHLLLSPTGASSIQQTGESAHATDSSDREQSTDAIHPL